MELFFLILVSVVFTIVIKRMARRESSEEIQARIKRLERENRQLSVHNQLESQKPSPWNTHV